MCFSSPKVPAPVVPPQPQEAKAPETSQLQRGKRAAGGGMAGGTLLTGPTGLSSVPTGSNTLLGS